MTISMRKFGLAAVCTLALALGAATQARAQDNVDPDAVALSTQLIDLAGTKNVMLQMLNQLTPNLTKLIEQANPGKEAEVEEVMNQYMIPEFQNNLPDLIHQAALIYAEHFTKDELGQMVAFYQSPAGKKLVQEQPAMMQEMGGIAGTWGQQIAVEAVKKYSDEFKKRGLQMPI
jgi:hypothetical protein